MTGKNLISDLLGFDKNSLRSHSSFRRLGLVPPPGLLAVSEGSAGLLRDAVVDCGVLFDFFRGELFVDTSTNEGQHFPHTLQAPHRFFFYAGIFSPGDGTPVVVHLLATKEARQGAG